MKGFGATSTTFLRRRIAALSLAVAALAAAGGADASRWDSDYFPNPTLVTQHGEEVRFFDDVLRDRIVVVNFIYTDCPDICGLATARLAKVYEWLQDRVGRDIFFVSVSLTPEADTPETLAAYAEAFGAGEGWYFLTGARADIDAVRFKLGERSKRLSDHRSDMLIGNVATGEWRRTSLMGNLVAATEEILALDPDWDPPREIPEMLEGKTLDRFAASTRVGEGLFIKACAACHSVGDGVRIGPDLAGVTLRRDRDWLIRYMMAPDSVLAEGDPIAVALDAAYPAVRMPTFGLGETDAADLVQYLHEETQRLDGEGFSAAFEDETHDHEAHDHEAHDH